MRITVLLLVLASAAGSTALADENRWLADGVRSVACDARTAECQRSGCSHREGEHG